MIVYESLHFTTRHLIDKLFYVKLEKKYLEIFNVLFNNEKKFIWAFCF